MSNNVKKPQLPLEPSTIENVDGAVYEWVNEKLNLFTNTNKGWKKTPVVWITGERSWQIKNKKELRNHNNNFVLPVITIERTNITKDKDKKGKYFGNIIPFKDEKGGSIAVQTIIKQNKTANFANASSLRMTKQPNFKKENQQIVYETKYVPMPVYVEMTYVIELKTEYQQQMNDLIQPFLTYTGGINYTVIKHSGHKYEVFIEPDFSSKNNINDLQENERLFISNITIKVLANLSGLGPNSTKPFVTTRENIVDVKIPKEYVIFGIDEEDVRPPFPVDDGLENSEKNTDFYFIKTSDGKYLRIDWSD